MSKKNRKEKASSKSKKKKTAAAEEEIDLSEYEDTFDGEIDELKEEEEKTAIEAVDWEEYELPEDFVPPEEKEGALEKPNWFRRRFNELVGMSNVDRLYWIKVLIGTVGGIIMGLAGAKTGWWLFLVVGLYGVICAGGYFLFRLKDELKWTKLLFSGFFPYLALFAMFWVLMFTSLYAPGYEEWFELLKITTVVNQTDTTYTTTITNTTSAAGNPLIPLLLTVLCTLGLLQFLLRKYQKE